MEIFTGAASSALSEIGKWVWNIAASKINYILYYDRKVEELKHLVQKLEIKMKDIEQEVDAASINGGNVRENVSHWFQNLGGVKRDARRLEEEVKEVRRFMGCCWDCFSSYKIGKEVAEKIATATELLRIEFNSYCHAPLPQSLEPQFPNRGFQGLLSTKLLMDRIWEALNNEKNYIIGVYGMGGVGKTTIMKEVAKDAKKKGQYSEVIMVTVSQIQVEIQAVKKMQTEIADQLGLQFTNESEIVRVGKILTRIKGASKILIILDDLWGFLDTSKIGIPSADENKECKVVITTRSENVCRSMECQKHIKVEPLSEKESWDLFKLKVGDVVEKTHLREVAVNVAKECGGLPLAIITLGRAMRDKDDISTWMDVLTELQRPIQIDIEGMEDSVFKCIRRSFDYMKSDEAKLCFLLCSLFPEDWEIDIIDFFRYVVGEGILVVGEGILPRQVNSMEEAWNRVCRWVGKLKDCCLLLEGKDSEHFKMHDVVRDVAIWISSDKTYGFYGFANKGLKRWPEIGPVDECQRISFMGNSFDSLPEQPIFPKLRTMILKETRISTIPDRFFQRMEALLVLHLRTYVASLPSSFPCLVNLKALFLFRGYGVNFDVTSLSLIGKLKNLEILQLEDFDFGTVPKEFGNLTSLRCLDLLGCTGTIPRNLISRLSRLEQLYLTKVFSNWQVEDEGSSSSGDGCAATFAELASLSCLTTLHVDIQNPDVFVRLQDLNIGQWQALTDFKIVVGTTINYLSFGQPSRSRRKELTITKSTYKYKWVIDLVTKTERLCLRNWSGMECLIGGTAKEEGFTDVGHKLYEVEELALLSMPDMRSTLCTGTLPNDILLRKLSRLEIRDCHKLIDVFPIPNKLVLENYFPSLRDLIIAGCHSLTYLLSWRQAKGLPHLQRLDVYNCERMETVIKAAATDDDDDNDKSLASAVQFLPHLEYILLMELPELRSVWGRDDDGVIMLPAAGSLQNLQRLSVCNCKRLKDDHILPPILPIPNKLQNFPSLRELDIAGCDSLTYLLSWRQAKGLPHLQTLDVWDCERMEAVIKAAATDDDDDNDKNTFKLLPRLERVDLRELPELRSVWGRDDDGVIMLPAGSLQNLQTLRVWRCKRLKDDHILPPILPIPNKLQNFPSLREFDIRGCHSLTYLLSWRQAKGLPHLQRLHVYDCERMETVIKEEEEKKEEEEEESTVLPSLTYLKLRSLPMLRSCFLQGGEQCSKSLSFKSLKKLKVVECPKLKKLPLSTSSPVLESLVGDSREWFESLEWGEDQSSIKERLRPVFQCD